MKKSNRGFTLVELLVVIAIIGILVALLLPAVQAARESARRAQCINNLKQVGIAMQMYHDTHKELPAGNFSCCWGTWQMLILPYIEEQQLADMYEFLPKNALGFDPAYSYDSQQPAHNPPIRNLDVVKTRIKTLTCPSDDPQSDVGDGIRVGSGATFHNYVANYGNTNHIGWDHSAPGNPAYIKYLSSPFVGDDWNLVHQRITKFKQIADGLSKTLMASETVQGRDGDLRGFTWWGWSCGFETFSTPNASTPDYLQQLSYCKAAVNPPCAGQGGANTMKGGARSRHPGGVNVVMCDGSVQFAVDGIDLDTWRAASTTKGSETYGGLTP